MEAPPAARFGNGSEDVAARWLDEAARSVPRYTSYPTAHAFVPGFTSEEYATWLARIEGPIALYAHIPFCIERCTYCACNVIATKHRDAAAAYLKLLGREVHAVSERLRKRSVSVTRMHWGGGTPTYYTPAELRLAMQAIRGGFEFSEGAEISIEADPRVTTIEHLRMLRRLGFNRLSIGVQDFAPAVQAVIGRTQSAETTRRVVRNARSLGFDSVNFDLVYGLPLQTERRIAQTMESVVEMRPDRIAIYGYAHLPHLVANQRRIESVTVPGVAQRLELEGVARKRLIQAGYVEVGLDHFALPTDPLAKAAAQRTLHRDFMGYTTYRDSTLIALGVSSISELPQGLVQNVKKLSEYERALDRGELPVEKGCRTNTDDLIRRHVIQRLMCDLEVRYQELERTHSIRFEDYFEEELRELRAPEGLIARGIARETPAGLNVEPAARGLVRNVCHVFDLRARQSEKPPAGMSSAV